MIIDNGLWPIPGLHTIKLEPGDSLIIYGPDNQPIRVTVTPQDGLAIEKETGEVLLDAGYPSAKASP